MSSLTDDRIQTIAQCFAATNFMNKSLALRNAGYSEKYANTLGLQLYRNIRVKAAIKALQAKTEEKTGYTIEQAQKEYEEARQLAMDIKQPGAAAANIMGKCRLHGFDKDNRMYEQVIIVISPKQPSKTIESEILE